MKEDLSDLEEQECQEFILSQEESDQKKVLWTNMYGDWLREKEKINLKKALLAKVYTYILKKFRVKTSLPSRNVNLVQCRVWLMHLILRRPSWSTPSSVSRSTSRLLRICFKPSIVLV